MVVFQFLTFSQSVARVILHKSDSVTSLLSVQQITSHLIQSVSKPESFCLMRLGDLGHSYLSVLITHCCFPYSTCHVSLLAVLYLIFQIFYLYSVLSPFVL